MQEKNGVYYHTPYIDGKVRWTRLADNFSDALKLWADREGAAVQAGSTVNHLVDRYTLEILPTLAEKTQSERIRQGQRLKRVFGAMLLGDVKPHHIAAYLDQRIYKVAANREITFLSSMYQYAMRWGWCDSNPCAGIRRNHEHKRDRYITDAELQTLIDAANDQLACIIELGYLTALRKSDLLRIRLNDLREDGLHVQPRKTGPDMVFSYSPRLSAVLARAKRLRRRASSMTLFATRNGTPHTVSGFNSMWRRLKDRCGLSDLHFHDIRAKSLTDAKAKAGSDYAQALGNHASVQTTEGYVKAREKNTVDPLF